MFVKGGEEDKKGTEVKLGFNTSHALWECISLGHLLPLDIDLPQTAIDMGPIYVALVLSIDSVVSNLMTGTRQHRLHLISDARVPTV